MTIKRVCNLYAGIKILAILWALPNTLIGLLIGMLSLVFGGKIKWIAGAIEFHGGLIRLLLRLLPNNVHAMTLGHTIIGWDSQWLDRVREHEHVHVGQYERWGPLFIPAYLLSSAYLKLVGKDSYYDNPFEKQAFAVSTPRLDTENVTDKKGSSKDENVN